MSNSTSMADDRLDRVVTQWSLLRLAHEPPSLATTQARQRMVLKYNTAIRRYVGALIQRDADADEVTQDVLVRLLRGDFATADPTRGRFRDFLKVAVKNMVRNYWSQTQKRQGVDLDVADMPDQPAEIPVDAEWMEHWRGTVLAAARRALEAFEEANSGCVYARLFQLRIDHPDEDAEQLAQRLAPLTAKTWKADAVRQQLRRARLRFAQFLIEEVAAGLPRATPADVEAELADLGLIDYVRPFLPPDWQTRGELCLGE